jgi:hypothetical protein
MYKKTENNFLNLWFRNTLKVLSIQVFFSIRSRIINSQRFETYRQHHCETPKYLNAAQSVVITVMPIIFTWKK